MIKYEQYTDHKGDTNLVDLFDRPSDYHGIWSIHSKSGWASAMGGCYGSMPRTPGLATCDKIRIVLWKQKDLEQWWYENLLNTTTSPWRTVCEQLKEVTIYLDSRVTSKKYGVLEMGVNPEMSFSNLMSLMIALRQTRVEPQSVKGIYDLWIEKSKTIEDLTFAEVVAYYVFTLGGGVVNETTTKFQSGNGWLGSTKVISIKHIAQGVLANVLNPIKSTMYYPSDATWGSKKEADEWAKFLAKISGTSVLSDERVFRYTINLSPLLRTYITATVPFEKVLEYSRLPILKGA